MNEKRIIPILLVLAALLAVNVSQASTELTVQTSLYQGDSCFVVIEKKSDEEHSNATVVSYSKDAVVQKNQILGRSVESNFFTDPTAHTGEERPYFGSTLSYQHSEKVGEKKNIKYTMVFRNSYNDELISTEITKFTYSWLPLPNVDALTCRDLKPVTFEDFQFTEAFQVMDFTHQCGDFYARSVSGNIYQFARRRWKSHKEQNQQAFQELDSIIYYAMPGAPSLITGENENDYVDELHVNGDSLPYYVKNGEQKSCHKIIH